MIRGLTPEQLGGIYHRKVVTHRSTKEIAGHLNINENLIVSLVSAGIIKEIKRNIHLRDVVFASVMGWNIGDARRFKIAALGQKYFK